MENCSKTNLENHKRYSPQKVQKVLRKSHHESIVFLITRTEISKIKRNLQKKKMKKLDSNEGNLKKNNLRKFGTFSYIFNSS